VVLYCFAAQAPVPVAEFRWSPAAGVTLTVLDPGERAVAQELFDGRVRLPGGRFGPTRQDGPAFMQALVRMRRSTFYQLVDESDAE
jgi:hypothetical protein